MKELYKAKSKFRARGVSLIADKQKNGAGGFWKFAGEDNLIKTIQKPLIKCGLEIIAKMNYLQELSVDIVEVILVHIESGESEKSTVSLPTVTPRKSSNGNEMWLDAEIERAKLFGYWSRILTIRLLGLSDIEPEDTENRPEDLTQAFENIEKVKSYILELPADKKDKALAWVFKIAKITDIDDLSGDKATEILSKLEAKRAKNENLQS